MNAVIVVSVVTIVIIHKDHTTVTVEMDLCYKMMEKHVKVYINNLLVNIMSLIYQISMSVPYLIVSVHISVLIQMDPIIVHVEVVILSLIMETV